MADYYKPEEMNDDVISGVSAHEESNKDATSHVSGHDGSNEEEDASHVSGHAGSTDGDGGGSENRQETSEDATSHVTTQAGSSDLPQKMLRNWQIVLERYINIVSVCAFCGSPFIAAPYAAMDGGWGGLLTLVCVSVAAYVNYQLRFRLLGAKGFEDMAETLHKRCGVYAFCGSPFVAAPYATRDGGWGGLLVLVCVSVAAYVNAYLLRFCLMGTKGFDDMT